ncbi:hypothetical protein PoB_001049000 [Plakobranchus ocellatus]|uniref:Glycosyltransferase family 92 protein n=1 Tax=Plakobranchus ocellatus TaxID=259542 RepID=A0AAV3YMR0_9GAST|nr:hypothetical protein PoB_001049000 [Plakobranchus ocellatus]
MGKRQLIILLCVILSTALLLYVHEGKCCDSSSAADKNTDPPSSVNATLKFIPLCTTSADEIVATLPNSRWRLEIVCSNATVLTKIREVTSDSPPFHISWDDGVFCLRKFLRFSCFKVKGQKVPNLVHYVWFGRNYFRPEHLISVLSAVRYQKPCAILFHSDHLPYGDHWRLLLHLVPEVIHIIRHQPQAIFGHKFGFIQHKSDVVRIQALMGD